MTSVRGILTVRLRTLALAGASLLATTTLPALAASLKDGAQTSEALDNLGFFGRFIKAYEDEWGKATPVPDPNAPPSHRPLPFPPAPVSSPPFPFTEWPYGGSEAIGASTPNAADSPFMTALAPTDVGKWMYRNGIQAYGWVETGGNLSTAEGAKQGNFPAAYMYKPNTVTLDQAVIYIERIPDTVQQDHIDWGFRVSGIYGMNYRYTNAYGVVDYQYDKRNNENGYDFPMVYGEIYFPKVAEGLLIRAGRYISVPDIEAQLAPNNYMYSHSMTYAYDNYTNTGIIASLQATNNWVLQLGVSAGTETIPGNVKDPGTQPTLVACARYTTDSSNDNAQVCANGINDGTWGYNNLQWYGITYYHKFDEKWHLAVEAWDMHQNNVAAVGTNDIWNTPGLPTYIINPAAQPGQAYCAPGRLFCDAKEWSALAYLNYRYGDLDNFTWRAEYFSDMTGQRTGVKADYDNFAFGWQHWLSPSIYIRPEIASYNTVNGVKAFGRDAEGTPHQSSIVVFSVDTIIHF
jgi:type II secretory pathway pseudopilin PulG